MSLKLFNAPSKSSSMNCTYPPTTKPSKQSTHGNCKPITRNKLTRSPLFFLRSSSPSLWLGHRCRHYGSLHSRKEVVAKMGKEKSKDGDNDARIECKEPNELKALCDLCSVQVLDVIEQLGEMGKVVTYLQVKNKWDHLRKQWRVYNECFHNETGLGIDAATRRLHATNKWWTRKIAACPKAKTFNSKAMPNRDSMDIRFRGTIAMGKNAFYTSGQIPKESTEGLRTPLIALNLLTPNVKLL